METKVTYRIAKQAKNTVRYEPTDETKAMGPVYLPKALFGIAPNQEVDDDVFPKEIQATFTA